MSIDYIGNCPIYTLRPTYVHYDLPFARYKISTPFGDAEINVSRIFLNLYDEHLAVAFTAWGDLREKFKLYDTAPKRNEARDAFIKAVTFERKW